MKKEKFHEMALKMHQANELPGSMVNWAFNLLSELDENAIIFCAGDNDTYALWLAQEALGCREDVQIINTSLIAIDDYRAKMFAELGIENFKLNEDQSNRDELYEHILKNKKGIPAYVFGFGYRSISGRTDHGRFIPDRVGI